MEARPPRVCAVVFPLDFDIILRAIRIHREHIETHRPPVNVRHVLLRVHLANDQLRPIHDDAQDVFHPRRVVLHASVEERIINQTKPPDSIDQLFPLFFVHVSMHLLSYILFYKFFYREARKTISPIKSVCIIVGSFDFYLCNGFWRNYIPFVFR